jgi:hypothetical protein
VRSKGPDYAVAPRGTTDSKLGQSDVGRLATYASNGSPHIAYMQCLCCLLSAVLPPCAWQWRSGAGGLVVHWGWCGCR